MSSTTTFIFCAACGNPEPSDLLEVTNRASGHVRYLCRPARANCFARNIRDRDTETVTLLVPPTPEEMTALADNLAREKSPRTGYGGTAAGGESDHEARGDGDTASQPRRDRWPRP
jgi:hypothetical protein